MSNPRRLFTSIDQFTTSSVQQALQFTSTRRHLRYPSIAKSPSIRTAYFQAQIPIRNFTSSTPKTCLLPTTSKALIPRNTKNNFGGPYILRRMVSTEQLKASSLFDVKGHVALITGGGTGIGLMAAQALAANGAKVYITGRRMEVLETAAKSHSPEGEGAIIPIGPCDVTSKGDLTRLYSMLSSKESHLDILITASGIAGPKASPDTSSAKDLKERLFSESQNGWADTYNTDVTAVYFTSVAFLPLLQASMSSAGRKQFHPSIIVISSMSGMISHAQSHFSYNAAKAGTVHLSKMMAHEFKETGIRINSIAPGYFPSEMTTGESDAENKSQMPEGKIDEKGHVPAGREGSDEEMGMAVLFLAGCRYVNGEVLVVDGGVMLDVPAK